MLRMKDSGDYTNNNEIPFSFLPCLTAGLAYYISMKYAPDRIGILKQVYEEEFQRAADTNRENVSSHFVPYIGLQEEHINGKIFIRKICFTNI